MTKIALAVSLFLISTHARAYSVADHKLITQLAIQELIECQMLPSTLKKNDDGAEATKVIVKANLDEDSYLKNGVKKLLIYSHFYNPVRPLKQETIRAYHAVQAVTDYTNSITHNFSSAERQQLSKNNQKSLGKIIHLIQDASSAPHVLWINHGMYDGFENKIHISSEELAGLKPDCNQISLSGLNSPLDIIKAGGLSTLKELTKEMAYTETIRGQSARTNIAPWSKTFFSNGGVYTQKVLDFLSNYLFLNPNLNTPTSDDQNIEGWNTKALERGKYGPLSNGIRGVTFRGDNFGKQSFTNAGKKYSVETTEYTELKKTLMRQAILSTQRTILWINTL